MSKPQVEYHVPWGPVAGVKFLFDQYRIPEIIAN